MFQSVEIPVWLLALILVFAGVTFLSHFLFPSVRWYFRRRMERVVAQLNKRLKKPIEPFKLARRHDTIERLTYDSAVLEAVGEHAAEEGVPENVALERARRYAREIVPSFSATAYFGFATRAARWLSRMLYDVRLDAASAEVLEDIDPDATVIFVMNHRSNMDYVLITYIVAERSALAYAVGEWARVWPLSPLIRAMGAYFIRRRSRNALYRRVLASYVQLATAAGVTQGIFPEGGLSLDGRMGPLKLGLVSYITARADPRTGRDVVFVPVALSYDRVLEDRILTDAAASGTRRFRASVPRAMWFLLRYAWRRVTGQAKRFGVAGVRFGQPLSMRARLAEDPDLRIERIGADLRKRMRDALPILPVPLIAWIVTNAGAPVQREALVARAKAMLAAEPSRALGADRDAFIADGLAGLTRRHLLQEGPDGFFIAPGQEDLVTFYANSVAHVFDAPAGSAPPG